ncbi:probable GCV1 - glycine decarboxylase, subunit T, mitochondrial [Ustilago trichophora]|uniref:Aminomethyltransferase n=1 Tax=Ustilago trichophora TaxID=86804 RepID=A0A5C3DVG1_9BASI|nr:probable GCV1 - glycine decarboxylase, subunit T, mitochondrial [Ustilago trichophora]
MLATRSASAILRVATRSGAASQLPRHLAARVAASASIRTAQTASTGSISLRQLHSSSVRAADAKAETAGSSSAPLTHSLSKTGLYDFHVKNGGKMVPFGGYLMPLTYGTVGQVASHHHVRTHAGLFDVGHMVQHKFNGAGALKFLQHLTPASLISMPAFSSTLSVLLNEQGGILDDLIITKHAEDSFYVVTNAGCRSEDLAWFKKNLDAWKGESVQHEVMDGWGLLALQGPTAVKVLEKLAGGFDLSTLTFGKSAFVPLAINGEQVECHVARAGYTGEDGFEISIPPTSTVAVAEALLADSEVQLAGLAARDSLRLEAGMCLYGHDLDTTVSPIEAALAWCVGKDRRAAADFLGAERVLKELKEGPPRRRIGLIVDGGIAREGAEIFSPEGKVVGRVTSGIPSPTLGKNIAMALVENGQHKKGTKLKVEIRKKLRDAQVAKMPFVENKFFRG